MTSLPIESINTKLEAYKLIHDSSRLFKLLYSKYGEIEDDYFISFINQLIYNIPTKYNRIYKESLYTSNIQEFLRRYYRKKESKDRLPKLSDYYKNYLIYFCRPFFKQLQLAKILYNFQDKQAEIFYKNNYSETLDYEREKDKKNKGNSYKKSFDELSSLDNITDNKIIFDEKTKKIIDNDLQNESCTLTLESPRNNQFNNNYKGELISKRSNANNSFEKIIHYLVNSQFKKKLENKTKKKQSAPKKKLINSPSAHPPYSTKIIKNNYYNINSLNMEIIPKTKKIKNSLYTLAKNNFIKNRGFSNHSASKGFLSPKTNKNNLNMNSNNIINSKLEDAKIYKYNNNIHSFQNFVKNNKNYSNYNKINTNYKNTKLKNTSRINSNTIYKNFSKLGETLNKHKQYSSKNSNITTYKNNFNLSKIKKANYANSSNLLIKSINKIENIKKKPNNINIPKNSSLNINMNKLPFHAKNKTFDFNSFQQNENLNKYNTNNIFQNYRVSYNINNQKNKKNNSKFNLIKKPNTEIASHIHSPSHDNKNEKDISMPNNKDKTKKIIFSFNPNYESNVIKAQKFDSPKIFSISRKNITYSSDENNKDKNLKYEKVYKNNNNFKANIKKNKNNNAKSKENIYNWNIKNSLLSNKNSKYNKISKAKKYTSFNNTLIDTFSLPKKEGIKSIKKNRNTKIKNNGENIYNIFNNSNRINNKFLEIVNDNTLFSRNKKQNTSKISSTKSQNEINLRDICIKPIKNLKSSAIGNKKNMINRTFLNKNKKNNNMNNNFKPINSSSSEIQNGYQKNILSKFNMKKIAYKNNVKKFSQRISLKNVKRSFCADQKDINNNNKINVIFNGDVIINKNQLIEIKQNGKNNNKSINKDINKIKKVFSPISKINKERENSFKIINVNRNINLINKKEKNINL